MAEPLRKALGEVNFLPEHAALGRVRAAQRRHAPPPEMTRELRTCARLLSHESGAVRLLAVQQLLRVLRGATSTALSAQLLSPRLGRHKAQRMLSPTGTPPGAGNVLEVPKRGDVKTAIHAPVDKYTRCVLAGAHGQRHQAGCNGRVDRLEVRAQ